MGIVPTKAETMYIYFFLSDDHAINAHDLVQNQILISGTAEEWYHSQDFAIDGVTYITSFKL